MLISYVKNIIYKYLFDNFSYALHKILKKTEYFHLNGKGYHYLVEKYNYSWRNERTVEVPLIWNIVRKNKKLKILEIGNVLSHYFNINHDVLDKYEVSKNVINQDIAFFKSSQRYDLIISISTFEHIGYDENPKENDKFLRSLPNIKNLIKKGGRIIFTIPIGYNKTLDQLFFENKIELKEKYYLTRTSKLNYWKQTDLKKIKKAQYDKPFNNANAIMLAIIQL